MSRYPLVVDGDTGYGGAGNIRRTIRGMAASGAAVVTIEDQEFPKRCTYAAGSSVRVVSREESLARIRTAIAARNEASALDDMMCSFLLEQIVEQLLDLRRLSRDTKRTKRSVAILSMPKIFNRETSTLLFAHALIQRHLWHWPKCNRR